MLRGLLIALSFLTIIPVRLRAETTEMQMLGAAVFFPIVGIMLGAAAAASGEIFGFLFSPEISAALMLLVLLVMTGGLHMDGLSDTFDALASKAGRERRLDIMKEGPAGPVGVTAMVFTLALKYLALLSLTNMTYFVYYAAIVFMPMVGRWAMLAGMLVGRPARADGLGRIYIGRLGWGRFAGATLVLAALMAGPGLLGNSYAPVDWAVMAAVVLVFIYMYVLLFNRVAVKRFGGLTGDVLGAMGETAEALFLLMVIAWSRLYTL